MLFVNEETLFRIGATKAFMEWFRQNYKQYGKLSAALPDILFKLGRQKRNSWLRFLSSKVKEDYISSPELHSNAPVRMELFLPESLYLKAKVTAGTKAMSMNKWIAETIRNAL